MRSKQVSPTLVVAATVVLLAAAGQLWFALGRPSVPAWVLGCAGLGAVFWLLRTRDGIPRVY